MNTAKSHNQGFSLIELLIAMAILSIIMVVVVQFMSTTSGAYQKNKRNLNVQSDSMQIMEQISDTIMQAEYIRVETKDTGLYTIKNGDKTKSTRSEKYKREIAERTGTYTSIAYDFVPDSYANYCENGIVRSSNRKVVVDFDDFRIVDNASGNVYPLTTDVDADVGNSVRSYRLLKPDDIYYYVKPEYIYVEYPKKVVSAGTTTQKTGHVLYRITNIADEKDNTCAIYMVRYDTDTTDGSKGYKYAKDMMEGYLGSL